MILFVRDTGVAASLSTSCSTRVFGSHYRVVRRIELEDDGVTFFSVRCIGFEHVVASSTHIDDVRLPGWHGARLIEQGYDRHVASYL